MAKLSQTVLAEEIGCKQSALSMFEQGDGTKLNDEVIGKLAKRLGVDLRSMPEVGEVPPVACAVPVHPVIGFCPNPQCPSNHAYAVDGRAFVRPDRVAADPVGGRFCALCGEVLVKRCPNCGASVHDGGICSYCGEPYVALA